MTAADVRIRRRRFSRRDPVARARGGPLRALHRTACRGYRKDDGHDCPFSAERLL